MLRIEQKDLRDLEIDEVKLEQSINFRIFS
jgi:hypothetical protein